MKQMTNCPNCAAPIDPNAQKCAYCDTPYPGAEAPLVTFSPHPTVSLASLASAGMLTPNEARRFLGLEEVKR